MIVEKFFDNIVQSRIIDAYVATAFIATSIFFIINISLYTPTEILMSIIFVTLAFKGLAHLMVSFIIMFFDLKEKEESVELQQQLTKLDSLVDELSLQQAKIKNHQKTKQEQ
jgi:hypothetical protein